MTSSPPWNWGYGTLIMYGSVGEWPRAQYHLTSGSSEEEFGQFGKDKKVFECTGSGQKAERIR